MSNVYRTKGNPGSSSSNQSARSRLLTMSSLRNLGRCTFKAPILGGHLGDIGAGVGKGGGGGGLIRSAGGAFGKLQARNEEEYFYKKQQKTLQMLRETLEKDVAFHKDQIKQHAQRMKEAKSVLNETRMDEGLIKKKVKTAAITSKIT